MVLGKLPVPGRPTIWITVQGSYRNRKSKFQDFSRTFQGLCTFFQELFFIDSNSPNTAYTLDFYPI